MINSYSKINLFLRVLKKNIKGLHNIQSCVMLIDLHDLISIQSINEKKDKINYSYKYSSQQFISGKGLENLFKKN